MLGIDSIVNLVDWQINMHFTTILFSFPVGQSTIEPLLHLSYSSICLMCLLLLAIYAVSPDCPKMIQFAKGLNVNIQQPSIWSQLQIDCCNANGIICLSQRVSEIDWHSKGLNGIVNETTIPSNVTDLILYDNLLTGSFPSQLPNVLKVIRLDGNQLTGPIPSQLPMGLIALQLDGNKMSGNLPSLPSTIQILSLGYPGWLGNHFSGTLRLNRPTELYIYDNWITDVVLQDSTALTSYCDLSKNPLLGNPNIAGLTMCTQTGLYSAALLPVTISTMTFITSTTSSSLMESTSLVTLKMSTSADINAQTTATEKQTQELSTQWSTARDTIFSDAMAISTTKTTTLLGLSSNIGTVSFMPQVQVLAFNLGMIVRVLFSLIVTTYVSRKAPFARELKKKMKKGKIGETSDLEV